MTKHKEKEPIHRENLPDLEQIKVELQREKQKMQRLAMLRSALSALIVAAAVAVLVAALVTPVLRIYGSSMAPTLNQGDIVLCVKTASLEPGDLVAFSLGGKVLVKRVIAEAGQWVDIDASGNVTVDGQPLNEPYAAQKTLGNCNIALPYQVPQNQIFCLGDHRSTSVDSRSTAVGCIAEEQIIGEVVFRVWPLNGIGLMTNKEGV